MPAAFKDRGRPRPEVLLVADDQHLRNVLVAWLEDFGYGVRTASDGRDALNKLAEHLPDVVVLDAGVPDRSGAAFLAARQRHRALAKVPTVVISEHAESALASVMEFGAEGFLAMPFTGQDLKRLLEDVTAGR